MGRKQEAGWQKEILGWQLTEMSRRGIEGVLAGEPYPAKPHNLRDQMVAIAMIAAALVFLSLPDKHTMIVSGREPDLICRSCSIGGHCWGMVYRNGCRSCYPFEENPTVQVFREMALAGGEGVICQRQGDF